MKQKEDKKAPIKAKPKEDVVSVQTVVQQKTKKLTFTQKHQLEKLPSQIEALENEAKVLENKLNDPVLYQEDSKKFNEYALKLTDLKNKIEEAENLWLELQLLAEEN